MRTSYFAKYRGENAVSIAAITPKSFHGRIYEKLAPPKWLLYRFKQTGDQTAYESSYREQVLSKLNARIVFEELGENAVLLCYEKPGQFCHRHIVAEWFHEKIGIEVREIKIDFEQLSLF